MKRFKLILIIFLAGGFYSLGLLNSYDEFILKTNESIHLLLIGVISGYFLDRYVNDKIHREKIKS